MLYLASQSPIRKALLSAAGIRFKSTRTRFNEHEAHKKLFSKSPRNLALSLAAGKALNTAEAVTKNYVLGVDQVLSFKTSILHKPASAYEARQQLKMLSGNTHELTVAQCLVTEGSTVWTDVSRAGLTMRKLSQNDIDRYIASTPEHVIQSVGCYQIEAQGIQLFERIEGDYHTILGLPLLPLLAALRQFRIIPS